MTNIAEHTPLHTNRCWWNHLEARLVCDHRPPASATPPAPPEPELVDVRDMIVVHTAMLREFRLVTTAVAGVAAGATARAARVEAHLGFLCDLLHHHHEGEDELLWPKLRTRISAAAIAVLDEVEAQHEQLDAALHRVLHARHDWAADPTEAHRNWLVEELRTLHEQLGAHLDLEERALLPLAAAVLTRAEWGAVGEAAVASMAKPDLLLAFGMFAYEGDPAVLREMLAGAPLIPRKLLPRIAPRVYARTAARIYGTATP